MPPPPLLAWDFSNSYTTPPCVSVGIPADPTAISGFVGQTGTGSAGELPGVGRVFLTRGFGTNRLFVWLTVTRPVLLTGFTFTHHHTHARGSAADPGYLVQLELDTPDEIDDLGKPLQVTAKNSGKTDTIAFDRELAPGSCVIDWCPRNLKRNAADTGPDFFGLQRLSIHGKVLAGDAPDDEPDGGAKAAAGGPVACTPDPTRLAVFREAVSSQAKRKEWADGNLSCKAVAYSCGRLCRAEAKVAHTHDRGELAVCSRLAKETTDRLRGIQLDSEGDAGGFRPYFAAATLGTPPPKAIDATVIQAAFGGTISPDVSVEVEPMNEKGWWWASAVKTHRIAKERAEVGGRWRAFMKWFRGVPGLRGHSFVHIGTGDDGPGAVLPRLAVALTDAGSLVGAASFVVQT